MSDAKNLGDLKEKLSTLLTEESTDFQGIAQAAAEIAKQEPGVVRFTTDAAMIRRLGRELVAKQETALAELVKNAYDADANSCVVEVDTEQGGGSMEIIDDGNGMSRSDIENGFMRLANDVKVKNPVSPKYHRARAGKKGIGRFATERLGRRLTIVTQTEAETHGWKVTIDWASFDQGGDLNLVANSISETPKERPWGTRLKIENLNDNWSDGDLRRVFRYLSTLLQPAFNPVETSGSGDVTSFTVELHHGGVDIREPRTVVDIDSEIFNRAVAVIEAKIDDGGNATWWFASNRFGGPSDPEKILADRSSAGSVEYARSVELRAYYFIQRTEYLGHSTTSIKNLLAERGGIRLYRNGYRVPPYGEQYDDWLRLDRKRSFFAPISSKTFLGYVAVADSEGTMFEETSAREGLIENGAFLDVRDVMSAALEAAVKRIESTRGLGRGRKKGGDAASGERAATEAEAAVREIEQIISAPAVAASVGPVDQARLRRALDVTLASAEIARERDDLLKELALLRILASMGLTIAEFTHDFSHLAQTMELNVIAIKRAAETSPEELDASLSRFEGQFRQVRAYTAHFGNMMTNNASRDLLQIDLYDFVRKFKDDMSALLERRGFSMVIEQPVDYDIYTVRMHRSEWSSILLNLLTNSIKAAARTQRNASFLIRVGKDGTRSAFLEFSDNGDGIPIANRERVFDAFFTTTGGTAAQASDTVQAIGTGLGLKIVADIVESVGGTVAVVDPLPGYATTIRVTVPAGELETDNEGEA
jgi:signal transduction histidine kinase/anti-sigma regulatory factor (Ser/Thr protein kinase)